MDKPRVKPHEQRINFPGEDYTPDLPLPDIRLEHFAVLISRNVSKRGAVIQSFPLASPSSASFRASRILQDDKVRDRITFLRRRICAATASETPGEIARAAFAGEAEEPILDAPADDNGQALDKGVQPLDNLGHDIDNLGHSVKRRVPVSAELTPAELRRIIADQARAGNASALNAAIKLHDAQLSAPPQVADPAGLCAILFNGGGGGETLQHIGQRLFDIFGKQETISYFVSCQSDTKEEQSGITFIMRPCDTTAQPSQPNQQPKAQADEEGPAAGGGGGEGGEDARTEEV